MENRKNHSLKDFIDVTNSSIYLSDGIAESFKDFSVLSEEEEQKKFIEKILNEKKQVIELAKDVFGDEQWQEYYQAELALFGKKIHEKFINDECFDYEAWHLLIESGTESQKETPYWDLPEPYSVEFFLKDLIRKLEGLPKKLIIQAQQEAVKEEVYETINKEQEKSEKQTQLEKRVIFLKEQLTDLLEETYGEKWEKHYLNEIVKFIDLFEKKKTKPMDYAIWKFVSENFENKVQERMGDLLGSNSIESFLRNLIKKLEKKNQFK